MSGACLGRAPQGRMWPGDIPSKTSSDLWNIKLQPSCCSQLAPLQSACAVRTDAESTWVMPPCHLLMMWYIWSLNKCSPKHASKSKNSASTHQRNSAFTATAQCASAATAATVHQHFRKVVVFPLKTTKQTCNEMTPENSSVLVSGGFPYIPDSWSRFLAHTYGDDGQRWYKRSSRT